MKARPVGDMRCPACSAALQPLESTSGYVRNARAYAAYHQAPIPTHGPEALRWLAVVAHAQVVHPELELRQYLEDYLSM